jgi:hypothetical protein
MANSFFDVLRYGGRATWRACTAGALGLLALALPLAAHAGAGTFTVIVAPLSDTVTYSTAAQPMNIGYSVFVKNSGGNTINNITFTGTALATDPTEIVAFDYSENASCSATPDTNKVMCSVGQLKASSSVLFYVFFHAPAKAASAPTNDDVSFSGSVIYAEQLGGVPTSPPQNSVWPWTASVVNLGTETPKQIKTVVTKDGGFYFTGASGTPSSVVALATAIKVPSLVNPTTLLPTHGKATIDQIGPITCVNLLACWDSQISVVDDSGFHFIFASPAYFKAVLRLLASDLASGVKISSVKLFYTPDGTSTPIDLTPSTGARYCPNATTPTYDGIPCLVSDAVLVKVQGDPKAAYYEWTLLNDRNGTFSIR